MADIASLGLELDSRGFTQGMNDAAKAADNLGQSTDQVAQKVKVSNGQMGDTAKIMQAQADAARQSAQANLALGGSTNQLTIGQVQLIEKFREQAETIGMSRSQLMAYQAAQMGVTEQTRDAVAAVKAHEDALKAKKDADDAARNSTNLLTDALKLLAAGYAALKVADFVKDSAMQAARFETLGVVMDTVGRTAGYTAVQMDTAAKSIAAQGITMITARESAVKLVQAHVDLTNASKLARIAQDAAVIGNTNSSDAFERLVNGISRGNTLILRNIGINVNMQAAYAEMAQELGKNAAQLTENERVQARLNAVIERGADIAGTYEAAMGTAGKQILSMQRYVEDFKTVFGQTFDEVLTVAVMGLTAGLKDANGEISDLAKSNQLAEWGHGIAQVFVGIMDSVGNAMTYLQKFDAFARHMDARAAIGKKYDSQTADTFFTTDALAHPIDAYNKGKRIDSSRQSEQAEEDARYAQEQKDLSGHFDRFGKQYAEFSANRQAKQKADAAARLAVDQDYAAKSEAVMKAYAGYSLEVQQAAQKALADSVYVGKPTYRDTEGKPNTKGQDDRSAVLQDQITRDQTALASEKAVYDSRMKMLDDYHAKFGLADAQFYAGRENARVEYIAAEALAYAKESSLMTAAIADARNPQEVAAAKVKYDELTKAHQKFTDDMRIAGGNDRTDADAAVQKQYDDLMKGIVTTGDAAIKSLDAQIAKQKEHNAEIGKTKEQIELARQAQVQAAAADDKREADAIDALLNEADLQGVLVGKDRDLYAQRLAYLNINIAKEQQLAALRANGADAEAAAKAVSDLDKYLDPTKAKNFGDALTGSLNGASKAMSELVKGLQKYGDQQAATTKARAAAQVLIDGDEQQHAKGLAQLQQINEKNTAQQLGSYASMTSAAAGFFDHNSKGYKALQTASEVMHAAELAMNLASIAPAMAAGAAQFFAESGWGGFAGVAAMTALIAGFGVAVSGGGSSNVAADRQASQGTGTVLGDPSAKSDSISKAISLTASNSSTQINYLSGMLTALKSIETGIGNFAAELVKTTNIANPDVGNLNTNNGLASTVVKSVVGLGAGFLIPALGNLLGKVATSIFGGKQTLDDSGFSIAKESAGDISKYGAVPFTYADVKTSGGWFGKDSIDPQYQKLGADANAQVTSVINSLGDSIKQAGFLLGQNGDDFTSKIDNFVVDIGKISLKGLSADDQQKALESVFSKLGDQMAQAAIPDLTKFQQVGEGYLQTLVRVASDYAKVDASLQSINVTFGQTGVASIGARESLVALLGGIDDFQSKTADYAQNFLTKAQQLAPVQAFVSSQLQSMGLAWIKTRTDFAAEIASLSGNLNDAGAQQTYAALMNLESAFAAVTPAIDDVTKSLQDIADERKDLQGQLDQLTMTSGQLLVKQRDALDDSNKVLFDQIQLAQKAKDANDAAKTSLSSFLDQMKGFATTAAGLNNSFLLSDLTTLTPEQQLAEARKQFQQTSQAASGGDATAQGQLQSIEQTFLKLSQQVNGGDAQYSSDLATVMQTNDTMADWAKGQVSIAQQQLDALNLIASGVGSMASMIPTMAPAELPVDWSSLGTSADTSSVPRVARQAAAVAPVDYSSMGTAASMADVVRQLQAASDAKDAKIDALVTEMQGLRADLMQQTGDQIKAAALAAQQVAQAASEAGKTVSKTIQQTESVIA